MSSGLHSLPLQDLEQELLSSASLTSVQSEGVAVHLGPNFVVRIQAVGIQIH